MAAKLSSSSLVLSVLAMCAVNMAYAASSSSSNNPPAPSVDCSNLILAMADCLPYVINGSTVTTPEGTCCSAFKNVLKTAPQCLFEAFKSSAQFGVVLNDTKALNLHAACKASASSVDNCGLIAASAPPPAAGSLPSESSPTPTSGSASPSSTGPIGELSPTTAPSPGNAPSALFLILAGSLLLCLSIAQCMIQVKLTDNDLREIIKKIADSPCKPLKENCSAKTSSNKLYHRNRLHTFKYSGGKSMQKHIDDFNRMISDAGAAEIEVEDVDQALFLMNSVPEPHNNFYDAILCGRSHISVENVKEILIKMKQKKLLSGPSVENHANVVTRECNQESGSESESKNKRSSESKKHESVNCLHCPQTEHIHINCPERKQTSRDSTNIIIEGSDDSDASSKSIEITSNTGNEQIMNSSPPLNMAPSPSFPPSYKKRASNVKLGRNRKIPIAGK